VEAVEIAHGHRGREGPEPRIVETAINDHPPTS